jgi:nuclear receptor subfamily 2 group E protein 1
LLLEQSWRELFVLGAAQYLLPLELSQLVSFHGALTHRDSEHAATLLHEVKVFQDTLSRFKQLHVDPHEYACLRAIVLFRTNGELQPGFMAISDFGNEICDFTIRVMCNIKLSSVFSRPKV